MPSGAPYNFHLWHKALERQDEVGTQQEKLFAQAAGMAVQPQLSPRELQPPVELVDVVDTLWWGREGLLGMQGVERRA